MSHLMPRQPVPALDVPTLDGGRWDIADNQPKNFNLIVFYRGLHYPICAGYVRDLDRKVAQFRERGVEPVVISSDTEDRARETKYS